MAQNTSLVSRYLYLFICVCSVIWTFPQASANCVDSHSNCPTWIGFCGRNAFVNANCKKTCNDPSCQSQGGGGGGGSGGAWSSCSKTCGKGTKWRTVCSGGSCSKEWDACSTHDCPAAVCSGTRQQREGIPHSCCQPTFYAEDCGETFLNNQRVVSGTPAFAKKHPWIVAINAVVQGKPQQYCAGTLLTRRHVITAAHCMADIDTGKAHPVNSFSLSFGLIRLSDTATTTASVKSIHFVPLNDPSKAAGFVFDYPKHDIAIIELNSPVRISSSIYPICLPGGEITPKDTTGFIAGWGIDSANGNLGLTHLQEAAVQNLHMDVCRTGIAKYSHLIPDEHTYTNNVANHARLLCAGSIDRVVNSCRGDSGGPLLFQRCENCRWYLAGIVSYGLPDCTLKVPGVYTRVRAYESWINGIIGQTTPGYSCSNSVGP